MICSPFLLMACLGWRELYRRDHAWFFTSYLVLLLHWIVISGYTDLPAGNMFGPRLLLCALPWLAVPVALGFVRAPRRSAALALVACLTNIAALWGGIEQTPGVPLWEALQEKLARRSSLHHLGECLDFSMSSSLALWTTLLVVGISWLWRQKTSSM